MGVFDNAKKVPTGVPGLDALFYDGLQLQNFCETSLASDIHSRNEEKGLIIMLRGERGINKMRLALQMLHGISKSIYSMQGFCKYASVPYFFSLNKTREDMSDLFIDYLITHQIDTIIRENASGEDASWKQDILGKSLFDVDGCSEQCAQNGNSSINLPNDYRACLDKYLCERTIYYNNRTNALHFIRDYEGDNNDNLLFHRRSDNLEDYWKEGKKMLRFLPENMQADFFDVRFNYSLSEDKSYDCDNSMYPYSAGQKFQKILDCLENIEMQNAEKREQRLKNPQQGDKNGDAVGSEDYSPCIVIDGFAQLHTDELKRLYFPHIEKVLRRLSMVSILVFDERANNISCNADIVIDMRKKEYLEEDYVFTELQISKSVFQPAALGWHKYKVRNCGVEVYPSIHRLLQRRNYMSQILTHTHSDILNESYGRFMKTELMRYRNVADPDLSYERYHIEKYDREMDLLKEMYRKRKEAHLRLTRNEIPTGYAREILETVLLGGTAKLSLPEECCHLDDKRMHAVGLSSRWREYKSVTALIGNPNSFKRFLAIASTFKAARQKDHTLILLFDKEEDEMRRQLICPGFHTDDTTVFPCMELPTLEEQQEERPEADCQNTIDYNRRCSICSYRCKLKDCCHSCYKYIHFLNVRMGCISADELFSVLKQQIDVTYMDGVKKKKVHRIVIDDLQKIDYSFPFLKDERLFLTALVTLCRENNVELQILCDKKAGLTKELCSLADNVICIQRDEEDYNQITLFVERFAEHISPSEIMQYKISNVSELFICKKDILLNADFSKLDHDKSKCPDKSEKTESDDTITRAKVKYGRIGSMKKYWRKRYDVGSINSPEIDDEMPSHDKQ